MALGFPKVSGDGEGDTDHLSSSPADLMFDPWLIAGGGKLEALAMRLTKRLLEADAATRQRQHKEDVVERVTSIASSLIANLYRLHGADIEVLRDYDTRHARFLAVPMQKPRSAGTRYDRKGFSKLPDIVRSMQALGAIELRQHRIKVARTGIKANSWLLEALQAPEVLPEELGRAYGEETIWLTARMGKSEEGWKLPQKLIDYADTEETMKLRAEVAEINGFLAAQQVTLDGVSMPGTTLKRRFTLQHEDAPHAFNLHGRLYGAFWVNLPAKRRSGLRINGEPIADLDFVNMFPRLAYVAAGKPWPEGDLYALEGLGAAHRGAVKAGISALLSSPRRLMHLPEEVSAALPEGWSDKRFIKAVCSRHPDLVPFFGCDFGLSLMFTESRIMIAALEDLMGQGIAALPMHDGMMVGSSRVREAEEAMGRASVKVVGKELPVNRKALKDD